MEMRAQSKGGKLRKLHALPLNVTVGEAAAPALKVEVNYARKRVCLCMHAF